MKVLQTYYIMGFKAAEWLHALDDSVWFLEYRGGGPGHIYSRRAGLRDKSHLQEAFSGLDLRLES